MTIIAVAAFGCPLITPEEPGRRPYVDWDRVGPAVMALLGNPCEA